MRRTKIVATIGPATWSPERLEQLIRAGLNVARVNFSHASHDDASRIIRSTSEISRRLGMPVAIVGDLQGPKIRTGSLAGGSPVVLVAGSECTITTEPVPGTADRISTNYRNLPRDVAPGQRILLADGTRVLEVLATTATEVRCRVLVGGPLAFIALGVAGAFSFAAGLGLVIERGRAMRRAGEERPGSMAAILGMDADAVSAVCREASTQVREPVVVANDNAPGQIVISGTPRGVQAAGDLARAKGARRVVPLAVSIAAHSPLMEPAVALFAPCLRQVKWNPPLTPVIGNREARPLATVDDVLLELERQLVSPVQWTASIRYMVERGVTAFIEVGAKDVLTGLVKRIEPSVTCLPCGNMSGVEQAAQLVRELM
mgnify:CR=1 FL=1